MLKKINNVHYVEMTFHQSFLFCFFIVSRLLIYQII